MRVYLSRRQHETVRILKGLRDLQESDIAEGPAYVKVAA